jgi:pantetheine-phosphate adenylyltransferase
MKRLAIYPGSFNPFTVGHQNILEKAEKMFDEVIVAIGVNPEKINKDTLDVIKDYDEDSKKEVIDRIKQTKVNRVKAQLPSKNVEGYVGFLTEYVREKQLEGGYDEVIIIRGLRNGHDYDYEYNQTRYMWDQFPGMNIMCLFCDPLYSHISSSAYRALESVKIGSGYKYLAREIEDDNKN